MATQQPGLLGDVGFIQELSSMGYTPDQMRQVLEERRAQRIAATPADQLNREMVVRGVGQLGRGVAGLFGAQVPEDPMIRQARQLRALQQQFDTTTARGMSEYAQAVRAINPDLAQRAALMARDMAIKEAQLMKEQQAVNKTSLANQREEQLQAALGNLPEDASDSDILKVLKRYGSPDKVLSVVTASADRRSQQENQLRMREMDIQGRIDQAKAMYFTL